MAKGKIEVVHFVTAGTFEEVVVYVGDVAHHPDLEAAIQQVAMQNVVGHIRCSVPKVRRVIRGNAAHIDACDRTWIKDGDLAGCCVE